MDVPIQTPFTAKHPPARSIPRAKVLVADVPVTLRYVVCTPAPNVDVAAPRIVVVDVRPTKMPSSTDCWVEDACCSARRFGSESVTAAFSDPEPETVIWLAVPAIVAMKLPEVSVESTTASGSMAATPPV